MPDDNAATEDRRQVSVLFIDFVEFTQYAEQSDPELVRQLQHGFYATVRRVVAQHGGVVEKYIGDAAMVLFGAPVATETDALRCVRVGLELQRVLAGQHPDGDGPRFRVGVTTGEALVDVAAARNGGQAIVAGDVVNSASRLQAVAPPGGVLVDGRTHGLTANAIRYQVHQPVMLRGRSAPTEVWLAVAPVQRQHGVEPDESPLVEREHELGLLAGALRRVVRDRTPQLVTIFGQAGIGKSRLVRELRQRADRLIVAERARASDVPAVFSDPATMSGTRSVVWLTGDCPPFGENVTYAGLADVVKAAAGILDTDPAPTARERLQVAVRKVVEGPEADRLVEAVAPLVGLPAPVLPAEEAESAWRRLLVAIASRGPTVLVFEDLHWADESMLRFIELLAAAASDVPLLILGTARPELINRDASLAGTITGSLTITLPPLRESAMVALYQHMLGQAAFAKELLRPLMELANGNPLYAQEYVRMLVERGAVRLGESASEGGLPMPDSVHAVIANRVDLLDPADRAVLQAAAVVGMQFWPGAVAAALGRPAGSVERALRRLEQREFIAEHSESSMAGQSEFQFRHVLVRDVCYQRLPRTERIARHERTADWLDTIASHRHTDLAEVLANHRWAVHEIARTLGMPAEQYAPAARRALRLAARRVYALHALDTAASLTARAIGLFGDDSSEEPERLTLELLAVEIAFYQDRTGFLAGGGADQLRALAERLTAATGDHASGDDNPAANAARAWTLLGQVAWLRSDPAGASDAMTRAVSLFEPLPDSVEKIDAYAELARLHMMGHEIDLAIAAASGAAEIADRLGLADARANAQVTIATARYESGDPAGYTELRALTEECRANRLLALRRATRNLAYVVLQEGDWRQYEELLAESAQLDGPGGHNVLQGYADEATRAYYNGDFAALAAANGSVESLWEEFRDLRACMRALRDDPGALADAEAAVADARAGFPRTLWEALGAAALCRALRGERLEAAELLAELISLWQQSGVFASLGWLGRTAQAAALVGPEPAEALRVPLSKLPYRTPWAEAALYTVTGALSSSAGDPAEAGRRYLAAADLYATVPVATERVVTLALAAAAFTAAGQPDQAAPALAEVRTFAERNSAAGLLRIAQG